MALEIEYKRLIKDGFYLCLAKVQDLEEEQDVNVIFHEDVCATITRGRAKIVINPITCEKRAFERSKEFWLDWAIRKHTS